MKKLFLFSLAAAISFGALAQNKNSNKHHGKNQKGKTYKNKDKGDDDRRDGEYRNDRNDDRYDNDRRDDRRDDRYDNDRRDDRRDDRYDNDRSSNNNVPRKVGDAFQRDYPNASNVNWTKNRGVWTANFRRNGLFGGNNVVSYRANGQRVNTNNNNRNNPVLGRNDRRQQGSSNNPVYDKVFGKKQ